MTQPYSLETLAELRGKDYIAERDRLLQNQATLRQSIRAGVTSKSWVVRLQAKILEGWLAEHQFYDAILAELDAVNYEQERRTAIGIARIWDAYELRTRDTYHERILPLAWEAIVRLYGEWPPWKVVTFLHVISGAPVEDSVEPVLFVLEEADQPLVRSAAGETLAKLPRRVVERRLSQLEAKHRAVLDAIREARERLE